MNQSSLDDFVPPTGAPARTGMNIRSMFGARTGASLLNSPWQIIQVTETSTPGVMRMWALIGSSDLHSVDLHVPRVFYVNQKSARLRDEGSTWRRVMKTLPRARRTYNLFEYVMPETIFQQHCSDLAADLSSPNIEGIYETQVCATIV